MIASRCVLHLMEFFTRSLMYSMSCLNSRDYSFHYSILSSQQSKRDSHAVFAIWRDENNEAACCAVYFDNVAMNYEPIVECFSRDLIKVFFVSRLNNKAVAFRSSLKEHSRGWHRGNTLKFCVIYCSEQQCEPAKYWRLVGNRRVLGLYLRGQFGM